MGAVRHAILHRIAACWPSGHLLLQKLTGIGLNNNISKDTPLGKVMHANCCYALTSLVTLMKPSHAHHMKTLLPSAVAGSSGFQGILGLTCIAQICSIYSKAG